MMFFRRLPSFPPPGGKGAQHSGTKARAETRPVDPVPDKARDREAASADPPAASPIAEKFAKAEAQTETPPWLQSTRVKCIACGDPITGGFYCRGDQPAVAR